MNIIGLIAEYNPFHLGHLYQINEIKKLYPNSIIIAIISSSFTQRGEVSIINKWNKTDIALDYGIDLVIELPFFYATQSSDIFAKGAISILNMLKIDTLVFGTECDNIDNLIKIANLQLNNNEYNQIVKQYLYDGYNYPTALNKAIKSMLNLEIKTPNDLLALSYIKEILKINKNINIINIKRTNDYHDKNANGNIVNANLIRTYLLSNKCIDNFIPSYNKNVFYKNFSINSFFPFLKYQIINNINNLDKFLDVNEGIENRIKKFINYSNSWEELALNIKTKRYTYNKINRMLLHILTNLTKDYSNDIIIDYIRILGFNSSGRNYLNKIKNDIDVKLVTNYKNGISKLFDLEYKITCIYANVIDNNLINYEFSHKPIIKD